MSLKLKDLLSGCNVSEWHAAIGCGIQGQVQLTASAIGAGSNVVSVDQHGAVGIEQPSVQLLGGPKFYHLPVRVKYAPQCRFEKIARLSRILQRIGGEDAQHGLATRLRKKNENVLASASHDGGPASICHPADSIDILKPPH